MKDSKLNKLIFGTKDLLKERKEIFTAFIMYVISSFGMFMMNIILAKGVDVATYGQVSFAIALTGVLTLVATFGLPNASMKYVAEYVETKQYRKIQELVQFSITGIGIVSLVLSLGLWVLAESMFQAHSMAQGLKITALLLPFTALGLWRSKTSRGMHKLVDSLIPENIVRPYLVIVLVGGAMLIGRRLSLFDVRVVLTVAYALALAYGFWLLFRSFLPANMCDNEGSHMKKWLKSFRAMFIVDVMQEVFMRCDVMVAGTMVSPHQLGIYTAASKIALLNIFFLKIVDTVYAPKMSASMANRDSKKCWGLLKSSAMVSTIGSIPLYVLIMLVPEHLLAFFGQEFVMGKMLLMILATGQFVNAMTGSAGHALLMTGSERLFSRICVVYTVITVCACAVLAKIFGILGVAISFSVAIGLYNIILLTFARKQLLYYSN